MRLGVGFRRNDSWFKQSTEKMARFSFFFMFMPILLEHRAAAHETHESVSKFVQHTMRHFNCMVGCSSHYFTVNGEVCMIAGSIGYFTKGNSI